MLVQDEAVPEEEVVELLDRLDSQRRVIVAQADVLEDLGFDLYDVVTAAPEEKRGRPWRPLVLFVLAFLTMSMAIHPGMLLDHLLYDAVKLIGSSA